MSKRMSASREKQVSAMLETYFPRDRAGREALARDLEERQKSQKAERDRKWEELQASDSALALATREIRRNLNETVRGNFLVGKELERVSSERLWKEAKYRNLAAYVEECVPQISLAWAYVLMSVAREFEWPEVEKYGIRPLSELCKLKLLVEEFGSLEPRELIEGTHSFLDCNAEEITLTFAEQHSTEHLKQLVAIARNASLVKKGYVQKRCVGAVGAEFKRKVMDILVAAEAPLGTRYDLHEKRGSFTFQVEGSLEQIAQFLKTVGAGL